MLKGGNGPKTKQNKRMRGKKRDGIGASNKRGKMTGG